jgi:hypothetical protein
MELVPVRDILRGYEVSAAGKIEGVNEIRIHTVNVLDQDGNTYSCEIEFEADLLLYLDVEVEGQYHNHGDYEPPDFYTTHTSAWHFFRAEIGVRFDPKAPDAIEFEAVDVYGNAVELRPDQIGDRLFR